MVSNRLSLAYHSSSIIGSSKEYHLLCLADIVEFGSDNARHSADDNFRRGPQAGKWICDSDCKDQKL